MIWMGKLFKASFVNSTFRENKYIFGVILISWNIIQSREDSDKNAIVKLQEIAFPGEVEERYDVLNWEWEFKKNFYGEAEIFIVKVNDEIVGHYAFIPQEYIINGNSFMGGLAVDAMIHPDYRRQGMFTALQEYSLNNTKRKFTIAYTKRKTILPAELKGGYKIVKKIPIFIFPINFKKLLENSINISILNTIIGYPLTKIYRLLFPNKIKNDNFLIKKVDKIGTAIKDFFVHQVNTYDIYLKKSIPYIKWRFDEISGVKYDKFIVINKKNGDNVLAYFVLRAQKILKLNCLNIVDLEMGERRKDLLEHIIKFIILQARKNGYDCVTSLLLDDGFISKKMKYYGILKAPIKYNLLVHNLKNEDFVTLFKESKKIYLNFSDTDLM